MYTPLNMDKETGARKREFTEGVLSDDLFPIVKLCSKAVLPWLYDKSPIAV